MDKARHLVFLTDDEILCLDGKTAREEIVKKIEALKNLRALETSGIPAWFAPVIASATGCGKLETHFQQGYDCVKCGRKSTVHPLYKVGPKKGKPNPNKKSWVECRAVVAGVHYCDACYKEFVKPEIERMVETETRFEIPGGKVVREEMRICPRCKGECWDFDMGLKVTMMDSDGRYYGGCPHCGFESVFFGPSFKYTGKFRIVPVESLKIVKPGRFTYYRREKSTAKADK